MIEREVADTALTVLEGFSGTAITARRQKHRDDYVKACINEASLDGDDENYIPGVHYPSDEQMSHWYPGTIRKEISELFKDDDNDE